MIKLWLDDLRDPPTSTWNVVRNYHSFVNFIESNGIPELISFDHDLGEEKTGYDCAKWLEEYIIRNNFKNKINYMIHSMNPVGAQNIIFIMKRLER